MSKSKPGTASRMASQSGLLMLGNMFTLFVGFPFQIYLARTLGADQLGTFGLFEVIAQAAGTLFGFGLATTLVRFIPQHLELREHRSVKTLLGSVYGFTLLGAGLAVVGMLAGSSYLLRWVPGLQPHAALLPFIGAMTVLGMLIGVSTQALRAFLDIRYMIIVASFLQLAGKVAVAVLLFWLGWQLSGYLIAVVVSVAVALIGMLWGILRHVQRLAPIDEDVTPAARKAWWSFSRTMYFNSLLGMAAPPAERLLLASAIDVASVGVLMGIRQLQSFPQVLFQILVTVLAPMFVAAKARGDMDEVKHLYHIATDWICRLGFPLLIFFLIFGQDVLALYGKSFAESGRWPLVIIIVGQLFNLMTGPHGAMLNMLGHEKDMFKLYLISSIMLFAGLFILAPMLGLLGVALAGLFPAIFLNLIELYFMKKWLGISWWSGRYKRLFIPMTVTLLLALFLKLIPHTIGSFELFMAVILLYFSFALSYCVNGLTSEDNEIIGMIRSQMGLK
jgi:O-antigen/teichoic acid export membrane protein